MSDAQSSDPQKDPSEADSGAQPLTDAQRSEIEQLAGEDGMPDRELSQAEAAQLIEGLQHRTEGQTN